MIPTSVRRVLFSCVLVAVGCSESREKAGTNDAPGKEASDSRVPLPLEAEASASPATDPAMADLEREIESKRQTIEDLQAVVQMEQAKLDENPAYDQSFLLESLEEQQELRDSIQKMEDHLKEVGGLRD